MKFEIEAVIPAGYEPTGEFRKGEDEYVLIDGRPARVNGKTDVDYIILRKIEQWRPATVADIVDGPVRGRVKNVADGHVTKLTFIDGHSWRDPLPWVDRDQKRWRYAEVRCD